MLPIPPFIFPTLPSTWFIGHMSRALREMQLLILSSKIDLVIETRDARLPLSSINPTFESILNSVSNGGIEGNGGLAKRLIVYNKRDLAQDCFQAPFTKSLLEQGQPPILYTDSRSDAEIKKLLQTAITMAARPLDGPDDRISILIAGMPNVGKSSILNSLRRVGVSKGKAASTSSAPGHTRRLSTVIKISLDPPIYIYDTPGIMIPFLGKGNKGKEAALKLALTGGIKESLFEGDTVAEYLIWRLWIRCYSKEGGYTKAELMKSLALPPTTPLNQPSLFLKALAIRLSALRKGGEPDTDFAAQWLILAFREGKLGKWSLDGLGRGGEMIDYPLLEPGEISKGLPIYYSTPATISTEDSSIEIPISTESEEEIEKAVGASVKNYFSALQNPSKDDLSGHQAKKLAKVEQAKIREVKRKVHEVAKVSGVGGKGNSNGIQSARRRNYRR